MRVRFSMPDRFVAVPNEVLDRVGSGDLSPLAFTVLCWCARHRSGDWLSVPQIREALSIADFTWRRVRTELKALGCMSEGRLRSKRGVVTGAYLELGWPLASNHDVGNQRRGKPTDVSVDSSNLSLKTETAALREAASQLSGAERRETRVRKPSVAAREFLVERSTERT